jgi:hypothetical protein
MEAPERGGDAPGTAMGPHVGRVAGRESIHQKNGHWTAQATTWNGATGGRETRADAGLE